MISFSFAKKSSNSTISKNEECKNISKNEPVEFITSFTNTNFSEAKKSVNVYNKDKIENPNGFTKDLKAIKLSELSIKSKLKTNFTQRRTDIKDYICNDITPISSFNQFDVAKSIYQKCSKFKNDDKIVQEKLDKFNVNKMNKIMKEKKISLKRKQIVETKPQNPTVEDFVIIILGKYKGELGKISYVSEENDILSVDIEKLERTVKLRPNSVKIISEREYFDLQNSVQPKSIKIDLVQNEMEDLVEKNWLFVGLYVTIIDKSFCGGKYLDKQVIIEDVCGLDDCSCVTENGNVLYELSSSMLARVLPTVNKHAKILGGKHLSEVILVKKIQNQVATVFNENTEEEYEVDVRLLCQISL